MKKSLLCGVAALSLIAGTAHANDVEIFTGGYSDDASKSGEGSTYHEGFGIALEEMVENMPMGLDAVRVPSRGATDNADRVAASTTPALGIGQGGLEYGENVIVVRDDLPGECAVAYTNEARLPNWSSVAENAARVEWVVAENSGSESFIRDLYAKDFEGITPRFHFVDGSAAQHEAVTEEGARGRIGFYYGFPKPKEGNKVYEAAIDGLTVFGVLSPDVARTSDAYYLNRETPYQMTWGGWGETKTTRAMCSSALVFATDPASIADPWQADDMRAIIAEIQSADRNDFLPQSGPLAKLMADVQGMAQEAGLAEMIADLEDEVAERF